MVDLSGVEGLFRTDSSFRRCLIGVVCGMASFDATRGLTVRFLSSVLFTSIRRSAYPHVSPLCPVVGEVRWLQLEAMQFV